MRKWKNFRIMYIIFIGILFISICYLSVILIGSGYSRSRLRDEIIRNIDSRSSFFSNELSRQIDTIFREQINLVNDSALKEINVLWETMDQFEKIESVNELSSRLIQLRLLHTVVSDVNVFFLNQKMSVGSDRIWESWDSLPAELKYDSHILIDEEGISLTSYFPAINYAEDVNVSYFIQTRLGREKLREYLNEFVKAEEGWLCLLSPEGNLVAGAGAKTQEELTEQELMLLQAQELLPQEKKNGQFHLSGTRMATCVRNRTTGCWLLYIYPNAMVDKPLEFLVILNICAVGITLLLFLLFMLFAWHFFAKPVDRILMAMRSDDSQFYIREKRRDEFDYIYERYNEMVNRMNSLMQEKLKAEYQMKLAQLKQLQYQIQPHFLYNSIFVISRMATLDENEEIAEFTKNLGQYYQYITKLNSDWVTVQDEIRYLKNYLYIQETRFGDRIEVEMNEITGEICTLRIPPLILQPLVENAYEHGVKEMLSGGRIRIRTQYENGIFFFEVEDNGRGISEEELRKIRSDFKKQDEELEVVHGLTNVYSRIHRIYGENGVVSIERGSENRGTKISIMIKTGWEETAHV